MKGRVVKLIESSFVDGPGHRAAVFLQGCDMRCLYCHNPETRGLCDDCGLCLSVCPAGALSRGASGSIAWDEGACLRCEACVAVCPRSASPRLKFFEPEELASLIEPIAPFIDGLTFSGGECSSQPEFLVASARLIRSLEGAAGKLSVLADTNGGAEPEVFDALLPELDGFIFDLKAHTEAPHLALTGRPLGPVLRNLEAAARANKLLEVRTVLIESLNDGEEDIARAARLVAGLGARVLYRLIPFRPQGVRGAYAERPPYPAARFEALISLARESLGERLLSPRLD